MARVYDEDNKMTGIFNKAADLVILNIMFFFSCIPLVTIGSAFTALYTVTLKMTKNQESYIVKSYWRAFCSNFKRSTAIWIFLLAYVGIIVGDLKIVTPLEGNFWFVIKSLLITLLIVAGVVFTYVFPLQAKFILTWKQTGRNILVVSMKHMKCTIPMLILNGLYIAVSLIKAPWLYYAQTVYWIIGFAFVAYINSLLLNTIFDPYEEAMQESMQESGK